MKKAPIRIAIRSEGNWVVAYLAGSDTMDDAIEVARIARHLLGEPPDQERYALWRQVLTAGMTDMLKSQGVEQIGDWEVTEAPAHERAGNA